MQGTSACRCVWKQMWVIPKSAPLLICAVVSCELQEPEARRKSEADPVPMQNKKSVAAGRPPKLMQIMRITTSPVHG